MINEDLLALIKYRIEQADEALNDAAVLVERESFRAAVNRAYYAMFYSVLALLSVDGKETSKHSGAISLFDIDFIRSGRIDKTFSTWLHEVFEDRLRSDYKPLVIITRQVAEDGLDHARAFVAQVKIYLAENIGPLNAN